MEIRIPPVAATSGDTSRPGQGSIHDVVSPKDCPAGKLSDDASDGDFRHWCERAENNLASHRTWKGAALALRAICRSPNTITKDEFDAMCNKINEDHHGEGGFRRLSNADWIYAEKLTRLHQYLFLKLNKGMAAKCRVDDQNGFEMRRKLHKAFDPAHPEKGRQIIPIMRSLFTGPSTLTEELWNKFATQDKLNS